MDLWAIQTGIRGLPIYGFPEGDIKLQIFLKDKFHQPRIELTTSGLRFTGLQRSANEL